MNFTRILIRILIGLTLMASLAVDALVHFLKSYPGKESGCTTTTGDLRVGEPLKHKHMCGIYMCENNLGEFLLYYCQIPVSFAECEGNGVKTDAEWPDCCWLCVTEVNCGKEEKATTPEPLRIK